jgi:hypothetical protein
MTSQGSAYGRFQRAMQRAQLFHAELAARELGHLSLADALALALLIAQVEPQRWPKSALALAAVTALRGTHSKTAAQTLQRVARARGITSIDTVIERAFAERRLPSPTSAT